MIAKLEQIAFYFLLFSLPWQTRIFLYSPDKYFNEWNSAFIYVTDFVVLAILLLWIIRWFISCYANEKRKTQNAKLDHKTIFNSLFPIPYPLSPNIYSLFPILFFSIAAASLFQLSDSTLVFYRFLKLLEFVLLFFYVKNNFHLYKLKNIAGVIVFSALTQAALGGWQYHVQQSLGLKWLGESDIAPGISGVAKMETADGKLIRAYGTFPHPNVFAAFLAMAIFFLYYLISTIKIKFFELRNSHFRGKFLNAVHFLLPTVSLFFLTYVLFLTFSRSVIVSFIFVSLIFFWFNRKKESFKPILFGFAASVIVLFILLAPEITSRVRQTNAADQSIGLRNRYMESAVMMIKQNPLLGVGYGNFTNELENYPYKLQATSYKLEQWQYQPVHNIYLLIASEIGMFGLLAFLMFIFTIFVNQIKIKTQKDNRLQIILAVLIIFLLVGLTDHFFFTTQQGMLMFFITLGVLSSTESRIMNQEL